MFDPNRVPLFSRVAASLIAIAITSGCTTPEPDETTVSSALTPDVASGDTCEVVPKYAPSDAQVERDEIFALLAYAVVLKDWQETLEGRGYNIGSVLVNSDHDVVCWARNSVSVTGNESQHGEVRLLTNYLHNTRAFDVKGHKLYTTLEPCAMCAGMMTLTELEATIFGQTDPHYGDAIQRLEWNSKANGGFCPYPRPVMSVLSTTDIRQALDEAYLPHSNQTGITSWLTSSDAKGIYERGLSEFQNYQVKFSENESVLSAARSFLERVPADYSQTPYTVECDPSSRSSTMD